MNDNIHSHNRSSSLYEVPWPTGCKTVIDFYTCHVTGANGTEVEKIAYSVITWKCFPYHWPFALFFFCRQSEQTVESKGFVAISDACLDDHVTSLSWSCFIIYIFQMPHCCAVCNSLLSWWRYAMEMLSAFWSFLMGIYRWTKGSPNKGSVIRALLFSLMLVWTSYWTNSQVAVVLEATGPCDVIVIITARVV